MKSTAEELSMAREKLSRPISSKDNVPHKRKMIKQSCTANDDKNVKEQVASDDNIQILHEEHSLEKTFESRNNDISTNYTQDNILKRWLVINKTKYPEQLFKDICPIYDTCP